MDFFFQNQCFHPGLKTFMSREYQSNLNCQNKKRTTEEKHGGAPHTVKVLYFLTGPWRERHCVTKGTHAGHGPVEVLRAKTVWGWGLCINKCRKQDTSCDISRDITAQRVNINGSPFFSWSKKKNYLHLSCLFYTGSWRLKI